MDFTQITSFRFFTVCVMDFTVCVMDFIMTCRKTRGGTNSDTMTLQLSLVVSCFYAKNFFVVYYESMKRELKTRPLYECRCDERLKTKAEESTRLAYTGFFGELEHLKIETRLIDERFESVMGEYMFLK